MSNFYNILLKIISDYKVILRKNLSATKCTTKIRELGIKRTLIKDIDEAGLYKIGLKIIDDLRKNLSPIAKKTNNFYNGTEEFLQHLELLYSKHRLEKNNTVVHIGQKTSCALLEAIQLIATTKKQRTEDTVIQIKQYSDIVITYGNENQKKVLLAAIGTDKNLLSTLLPSEMLRTLS